MLDIVVRVAIIAIALMAAVMLVPRVAFNGELWHLVVIAIIFGLINQYLKPTLRTLSIPISLVALGLVGLVINTVLILLLAFLSGELDLGLRLAGWPPGEIGLDVIIAAFLTALVVSIVSAVLSMMRRIIPGV